MDTLNKLLAIDLNYFLIGYMTVFYSLEQLIPTRFKYKKRHGHLLHNIGFQVAFYLGNLLMATVAVFTIGWLNKNHVGLFFYVGLPLWLKLVLSVIMLDFVTYWFHRAAHRVPIIWRFHRVHHSDTSVDSSTNFRAHPLEGFLWFSNASIVASAIFGLDGLGLGLYFFIITPIFVLEHTNIKFPVWMDKTVGLVFTTPNLHKVHHEKDQYYTDSNYADIFILWDRIFGTYKYKPVDQLDIGLKEFEENKKQTFWYLMISPFISMGRVSSRELQKQDQPHESKIN